MRKRTSGMKWKEIWYIIVNCVIYNSTIKWQSTSDGIGGRGWGHRSCYGPCIVYRLKGIEGIEDCWICHEYNRYYDIRCHFHLLWVQTRHQVDRHIETRVINWIVTTKTLLYFIYVRRDREVHVDFWDLLYMFCLYFETFHFPSFVWLISVVLGGWIVHHLSWFLVHPLDMKVGVDRQYFTMGERRWPRVTDSSGRFCLQNLF